MIRNKNRTAQNKISDPWHVWCDTKGRIDRQTSLESIDDRLSAMRGSSVVDCIRAAIDDISVAARNIVPEVPNYQKYPADSLEDLKIYTDECDMDGGRRVVPLKNLLDENPFHENLSRHLEKISEAWPHEDAVEQLKRLSNQLIPLLYAVRSFGRKKIALAKNMGLVTAVEQLEKAYDSFCMIELTDDIEEDARRLFIERKITPYEFRVAICWAFELDREATKKINNGGNALPDSLANGIISGGDVKRTLGEEDQDERIANMVISKLRDFQKDGHKNKRFSRPEQEAIRRAWEDYKSESMHRQRATYKDFYSEKANTIIYTRKSDDKRMTLKELVPGLEELRKVIHNVNEQERQATMI